jgi:uncharacterized protein (DUF2141 family)
MSAISKAHQTRDAGVTARTGTASISGIVVSDEPTPQPLRRAVVTISGGELPVARSAITDDDGRFAVRNLPAGRFTISAAKRGFVTAVYGAKRPGRPGIPVHVTAGQSFEARISMIRAAVLSGTIRDEHGEPLAGLRVFAFDANQDIAAVPGSFVTRTDSRATSVETDDRGVYRVCDLAPGEYLVAAAVTDAALDVVVRSTTENDAALAALQARNAGRIRPPTAAAAAGGSVPRQMSALAVMFYPGTPVLPDAMRVRLETGDIREGLDFVMKAVPVTTVEGTLVGTEGPLPGSVQMSINPAHSLRLFALGVANPQLVQPPGPDGRFKYTSIAPGHYTIRVRATPGAPPASSGRGAPPAGESSASFGRGAGYANTAETMYAVEEFDVSGQPLTGLVIRLERGSRFGGRLAFASDSPAPTDLTGIRISLLAAGETGSSTVGRTTIGATFSQPAPVSVKADGTFEFVGLAPSSYVVQCTPPAGTGRSWWLRSAVVGGRDVLDSKLDISLGTDLSDAVLTLTDRHSELSGTLQSSAGFPAPEYFVIVFPVDAALRATSARRIKMARPGTDGRFSFTDLPSGDYLLAALTDVEPNEWQKLGFLNELAPAGVRVTLGEGERKQQDLRVKGGS